MSIYKPLPLKIGSPQPPQSPKNLTVHSYNNHYQTISNLGNGSFGSVELAKIRFSKLDLLNSHYSEAGTLLYPLEDSKFNTSNLVAIKTMKKKLPLLQDYSKVKEVKFILSVPSHPCLVQVFEVFIDDLNHQLHISMEALNQNLYQLIRSRKNMRFSQTTLKSILSQLLCAIKHIHNNQYFHRDVKPENILILPTLQYYGSKERVPPHRKNDNFIVKLGDYGLARHISNMRTYTAYVSTRWYRLPEILLRQQWYSRPIDIWAFGAVAAEVINFAPLFPGSNEFDQIWKILQILGSPTMPELFVHNNNNNNNIKSSISGIGSRSNPHGNQNCIIPFGGFWNEAKPLASNLGIELPNEPGTNIHEIVPCIKDNSLRQVIQSCLLWDPLARPDANQLSKMSYFKESVHAIDKQHEISSSMGMIKGIVSSSSSSSSFSILPSSTSSTSSKITTITTTPAKLLNSLSNSLSSTVLSPSLPFRYHCNKPAQLPTLPIEKPLLPSPLVQPINLEHTNGTSTTNIAGQGFPNIENSYENYFSDYLSQVADCSSQQKLENGCYTLYNNYGEKFKSDKSKEPRSINEFKRDYAQSPAGKNNSISTVSFDSEDILNLH